MQSYKGDKLRTTAFTAVALTAFAANSILCRQALGTAAIDAASFSCIRLLSGAITLGIIAETRKYRSSGNRGCWKSSFALFAYMVTFSFAYLSLPTGTGALILFGAVQITMILSGLRAGERPNNLQWIGLCLALIGLIALLLPGLTAPSPVGSALMAIAGASWGAYSLSGRGVSDPTAVTAGNFIRALPFAFVIILVMLPSLHLSMKGVTLAVISGSLASGIGYAVWYAALSGLSATVAATVQLAVPLVAAMGGVIFLSEKVTFRLAMAAAAILSGVGLAIVCREKGRTQPIALPESP